MNTIFLVLAILLPLLGGAFIPAISFKKSWHMQVYIEFVVLLTSALVLLSVGRYGILRLSAPEKAAETLVLVHFSKNMTIELGLDGLGCVFSGLLAVLWPLATLYSFEYMLHERSQKVFFAFYTATYGVTLGIAFADNMLTMYCFYEMLTLITTPLVMHTMTREAILASRTYMYYSLGGAAFAFIGMIFIFMYGSTTEFVLGGVLEPAAISEQGTNILLLIYVLAFFGFGVKAALCPFNAWLPKAGVAPTPVTALLHAVAVVKAGAFATMRLTYYSFGTEFLRGTWAQYLIMAVVLCTILYGSAMALKETHLKRRLAYSTISNLSYILFGVTMMTPFGLAAALTHMIFHAVMKISSFFCAGAVICKSGRTYIHQLNGMAAKMPKTFAVFTVSALALMGVPGLCGFMSKWMLAEAAVQSGNRLAYAGIGVLLLSALLTALYMLGIVIRACYPVKTTERPPSERKEAAEAEPLVPEAQIHDPSWKMLLPLGIFVAAMLYFGLFSTRITDLFMNIANGLF